MPYIYESHMGGVYCSEENLDYDDLYCETCGDGDSLLGDFENIETFLVWNADDIDAHDGHGGWDIEALLDSLRMEFDTAPALEEAIEIVKRSRLF